MASETIKYFIKFIIEGLEQLIQARESVEELNESSKLPFGAEMSATSKSSMADDAASAAAATSAAGVAAAGAMAVGAALIAVDIAVEQLRDSLKQGMELLALEDQLSNVSDVTGLTATELKSELTPALKGVVTEAELTALALEAIGDGAESIEEIEEYSIEALEALGLLKDGVRTASGELATLKNETDNLKANFGHLLLMGILPVVKALNASFDQKKELAAIGDEIEAMGVGFWGMEELAREAGVTIWRTADSVDRARVMLDLAHRSLLITNPELKNFEQYAFDAGAAADWAANGIQHLSDALRGNYIGVYGESRRSYYADLAENPNFDPELAAENEAIRRSRAQHEGLNSMYDSQADYYDDLDAIPMHLRNAEDAMYGYAGSVYDADAAIQSLRASTGSLFEETRRGFEDEFNAAEYFYQQMLASGADAKQAMDFLILSGLESEEDALAMFKQTQEKAALTRAAGWAVEGDDVPGFWDLGQQAMDNPELANQLGGGTIVNENGTVVQITFSGGVMDPEMVTDLIGEVLVEQLQALGVLP